MNWDSESVRRLRLRMGWSQAEMARRMRLDLIAIQKLEDGESFISEAHLADLEWISKQCEHCTDDLAHSSECDRLFEENESVSQVETQAISEKTIES